ncbi:hypothetical protein XHV734_0578 [Xanthomonas hortorum pv. vitians]|nr:hypothetical protein XHV734_0578 [Xanthomonas hortorum pv. vitians]
MHREKPASFLAGFFCARVLIEMAASLSNTELQSHTTARPLGVSQVVGWRHVLVEAAKR